MIFFKKHSYRDLPFYTVHVDLHLHTMEIYFVVKSCILEKDYHIVELIFTHTLLMFLSTIPRGRPE